MRRCLAALAVLLSAAAGCTDPAPGPEEGSPAPESEQQSEESPPGGLRVGVVLPPRDTGAADEVEAAEQHIAALAPEYPDDVSELRTVVPDSAEFVADLATLLVAEDYDLVCVIGRDAAPVVLELAERHAVTEFCAAPALPQESTPDNVLAVDVALQELGHVVGVALAHAGGGEPVALLSAGTRAGGRAFRDGVRAAVGTVPLRGASVRPEDLEAELAAALGDEVAAVAVDAGLGAEDLVAGIEGVAVLAPIPLLSEEDQGALRWRVRWERVLEAVIDHHLDGGQEPAGPLGMAHGVFAIDHGAQASGDLVGAVELAMAELEQGERDPLEPPEELADEADEDQQDAPDEDDEAAARVPSDAS